MTAMKTKLAAAALSAFGLLVATGYTGQAALASATSPSASHPCGTQSKPGTYKHVIWIWLENHSYGAILGSSQAPYFNTLAKDCGLATNYHNVTHPSLPNYIAATSGISYASFWMIIPDGGPRGSCKSSRKR